MPTKQYGNLAYRVYGEKGVPNRMKKTEMMGMLAVLEDELIHMMHEIEEAGENKRIVRRFDKAISEIENILCEYR